MNTDNVGYHVTGTGPVIGFGSIRAVKADEDLKKSESVPQRGRNSDGAWFEGDSHRTLSEKVSKVMAEMSRTVASLVTLAFILIISQAESAPLEPQPLKSFLLSQTKQGARSCSYTVSIKTSCSSPRYTRDQISLSFGDAYGNQVYAPRLDDPSEKTFERCSTDTFHIDGPCTHNVCYLYFYRSGYDGWKPDKVTVSGRYISSVTFYYKVFIPNGVWYGFDLCRSVSAATSSSV